MILEKIKAELKNGLISTKTAIRKLNHLKENGDFEMYYQASLMLMEIAGSSKIAERREERTRND